jgi:predicted RNA-binding protein Jag
MPEFDGKDLEEALSAAASAVGRPAGEIDYELVEGGRKGVFGLGSRRVRIRVADAATSAPRRMLGEILRLMGFSLEISEARREGVLELTLDGADRSRLLERDGELITALETVLGRMGRRAWPTSRRSGSPVPVRQRGGRRSWSGASATSPRRSFAPAHAKACRR